MPRSLERLDEQRPDRSAQRTRRGVADGHASYGAPAASRNSHDIHSIYRATQGLGVPDVLGDAVLRHNLRADVPRGLRGIVVNREDGDEEASEVVRADTDGRDRLPRDEIPTDLTCRLCSPPSIQLNLPGYMGHMAGKHDVYYEPQDRSAVATPAWWKAHGQPPPEDPADLPIWVKMAIVRHEIYGETWPQIAEATGKSAQTIKHYAKTPAAAKVRTQIAEMSDTKSLVKLLMESATLHMYADWLAALEWAKTARDHKMVHTMIKDIGLQPILQEAKQTNPGPTTLILNLGSADLKPIETSITSTRIIEAEVVVESDDA